MLRSTRSSRRDRTSDFEDAKTWILNQQDRPELFVAYINEDIGKGVFTKERIPKNTFLVEYAGEIITKKEGEIRETNYEKEGCFLYFFEDNFQKYCIDATNSQNRIGRYVNDSPKGNCRVKKIHLNDRIHLCLYSNQEIPSGTELRYDYCAPNLWWRQQNKKTKMPYTVADLKDAEIHEKLPDISKYEVFDLNMSINLSHKIDEGMSAVVYKLLQQKRCAAVKCFKQKVTKKNLISIAEQLRKLKHENIVQFLGYSVQPSAFLFEFCEVCLEGEKVNNLRQLLSVHNSNDNFVLDERLNYIQQATRGLIFLHENNIVHRNFKPTNLLVTNKNKHVQIKITDFDEMVILQQTITSTITFNNLRGMTLAYTAPELCSRAAKKPSKATDTYSLAISCYEIMSDLHSPWQDVLPLLNDELLLQALKDDLRPDISHVSKLYNLPHCELVLDLISKAWSPEFVERPSALECLNLFTDMRNSLESELTEDTKRQLLHIPRMKSGSEAGDVEVIKNNNKAAEEGIVPCSPLQSNQSSPRDTKLVSEVLESVQKISPVMQNVKSYMADFKITQRSEDCGNYVKNSLDFDDSDDSTNNEMAPGIPISDIIRNIYDKHKMTADPSKNMNCQKSISNDSALLIDADLSVLNTDSENEDSANEEINKELNKDLLPSISNVANLNAKTITLNSCEKKPLTKNQATQRKKGKASERPGRICIFCRRMQTHTKLSRHIRLCHELEPRVKHAMSLSKRQRIGEFNKFRREGILCYNKEQARSENPIYQRERKGLKWKSTKSCGSCNAFIATRGFSKHLKRCQKNHCRSIISVPTSLLSVPESEDLDEDFKTNILAKLRDNKVGRLCCKDKLILKVGSVFYWRTKRKTDKAAQVKKTVRLEMRRLGHLYLHFKERPGLTARYNNGNDMFLRCNFDGLREAIDLYSTTEGGKLKPGLKQNLLYLIKRSAKVMKAVYMAKSMDDEAKEVGSFTDVLELWEDFIFGDSQYELNKRRQINLRRPENLPNEGDVTLVRNEVVSTIKSLTSDKFLLFDESMFVRLRDSGRGLQY
ncbi:uncharacterized protein LOC130645001 [Hydractinia symbiolongicarpus]|uniref:uncharacterized protein LOC130645001 n=1 Tax=Hydractinia symbiolongicarpus TaxID=13093 RepID=UPI00254EDD86|nr:uncharacterized protein LOC130645001 [Hydractinia symbiolongicarpus]